MNEVAAAGERGMTKSFPLLNENVIVVHNYF